MTSDGREIVEAASLTFNFADERITVRRNDGHPAAHMFARFANHATVRRSRRPAARRAPWDRCRDLCEMREREIVIQHTSALHHAPVEFLLEKSPATNRSGSPFCRNTR